MDELPGGSQVSEGASAAVPLALPSAPPHRQEGFGEGVLATPAAGLAGSHAASASLVLKAALRRLAPAGVDITVVAQKGATVQREAPSLTEAKKTAGVHEEDLFQARRPRGLHERHSLHEEGYGLQDRVHRGFDVNGS